MTTRVCIQFWLFHWTEPISFDGRTLPITIWWPSHRWLTSLILLMRTRRSKLHVICLLNKCCWILVQKGNGQILFIHLQNVETEHTTDSSWPIRCTFELRFMDELRCHSKLINERVMASQTVINNATVEKKTWILFADTNIIHTPRRKTTACFINPLLGFCSPCRRGEALIYFLGGGWDLAHYTGKQSLVIVSDDGACSLISTCSRLAFCRPII